jgi:glyoxylase-like metal-dependent hydrolase (beta-lactamase superfamily II)
MRTLLVFLVAIALSWPAVGAAQDGKAALENVEKALGAAGLKSIEISSNGVNFALGQSPAAGMPWPRFNVKSFTRTINYDTATLKDEYVRTQALDPPRGGGQQPIRGEQRQLFFVSGDHAWNVMGDNAIPVPITLADRQMQLWTTPHGVVKAAIANNGTMQGQFISFAVPGRFTVKARVNEQGLIERVEAMVPHPVVGDLPVEVTYSDYRDFGGVKFPTRIKQSAGGHPTLDVTVTDVRPNVAVEVTVPDNVRQATSPYARVTSEMAADGVWHIAGGTHNSVAIEMKDHVIVVESPLNDDRALAMLAEVRKLVPNKPIRYLIVSHHHFDHAGGVRAAAGEGITVVTTDGSRAFFEKTLAAPSTVRPDHLAKSGRKPVVEGVRDRRVMTDGTRTVEIRSISGNLHADDLLMVYLPKEKLLIEADAFTPPPPNVTIPAGQVNPFSVNLAENITKQGLAVDRILPLHGRIVPVSELHKAIGQPPR